MALTKFTNLNYDELRISIKDYLRANSNFTDYDFDGSNLSTIINTLAYNTYIASYNANVVSNEVFIDSATLRENVVSLARLVGYVPKSRTAARATISFFVDLSDLSIKPLTLTVRKGLIATTRTSFRGESYTFSIPNDITVPVVNGVASFEDVEIYEGTFITENYTVDNSINQRFILSNNGIDTSLINVTVQETQFDTNVQKYTLAENLFDVNENSKVFFIQEVEDERYEIIFGDNVFGKKLDNLNYIEVSYIVNNGPLANGINDFSFSGRIFDNNGRIITSNISSVITEQPSIGGSDIEAVSTVRKSAPRNYSAQNRAVTPRDYESIVPLIYPELESISAFGGEELNPPRFGKVYISIKPTNGRFISNQVKDNIKQALRQYSVAGISPEIIDLKYLFIEYDSVVYYNSNTTISPEQLSTTILDNLSKYSKSDELNRYGARFKYSKFLRMIDDSDSAITSNITKIYLRRDLKASTNQFASYEICYGNEFYVKCRDGFNIRSSGFNVAGIASTVYLTDIPNQDNRTGTIVFFKLDSTNNYTIVRKNAGIVDYVKGEIKLYPINIISTSKKDGDEMIIQISVPPKSNDVIGLQDLYLQLDVNNSVLNTVSDFIISGSDTSGTNFVQTSSYGNTSIVRE